MESSQTGPQTLTFANHPKNTPRSPPGPQLWAVVLSIGGLYYLWTKILGRPVPIFRRNAGGHLVRKGHSAEEMAAARERQQQRLQMAVSSKQQDTTVRERVNINSGNGAQASLQEQLTALKESQAAKQKQKDLEEKKRKQRQLYLRKKAEQEKEEEERRKDEELGPGWRYRQNPDIGNAVDSMNPQAGSGGGGYKPQTCTRRGG